MGLQNAPYWEEAIAEGQVGGTHGLQGKGQNEQMTKDAGI